jgi:hypothetical protein
MHPALRQPLGRQRAEVLDVVRALAHIFVMVTTEGVRSPQSMARDCLL